MNGFKWFTNPEHHAEDALSAHRERVMYPIAVVGVLFLLPFSINDFVRGRYALGVGVVSVVALLGINAVALRKKRSPPLPFALLLIPMAASMTISLKSQGVIGAFWCYPTVLFFYFVLSSRLANLCSIVLLLVATGMVYRYIGVGVMIRFMVTLTMTIVVINIILNIINDLQRRLLDQAITDPLTGAYNRRHMESCLADAIERNRRTGSPASLLLIDVDHFKNINDRFGHETGDRVLKRMVSLITKRSRRLDLLFRMGGEEFLLFLSDTKSLDAMKLAEDLRASVARSHLLGDWQLSVSIGVSELRPGESLESWVKGGDNALYAAKQEGRDRVICRDSVPPGDGTPLDRYS
jgi:diguanylate cyclase (GGDEF)-like protein